MDTNGITIRKKNRNLNISNIELFNLDSNSRTDILDSSSRSLPSFNAVPEEEVELKRQMISLQNELDIAHKEIENLNITNEELKSELQRGNNQLKYFKSLCTNLQSNPLSRHTRSSTSTPISKKQCHTPTYRKIATELHQQQPNVSSLRLIDTTISFHTPSKNIYTTKAMECNTPSSSSSDRMNSTTSPPKCASIQNNKSVEQYDKASLVMTEKSNRCSDIFQEIGDKQNDNNILGIFFDGVVNPQPTNSSLLNEVTELSVKAELPKNHGAYGKSDSKHASRRVIIFADENGKDIGASLQKLLGDEFKVFSLIKSNASTKYVLETCAKDCKDYTKQDFIIVLTGSNDTTPLELQSLLYCNLCKLTHTNVLLGTIYRNKHLNVQNVNRVLRSVSSLFKNSKMLDLDLHSNNKRNVYFNDKLFVSRFILKDILHICYRNQRLDYYSKKSQQAAIKIISKTVSTQTLFQDRDNSKNAGQMICVSTQTENILSNQDETFFRQ